MSEPFGPSSRYRGVSERTRKRADGREETFVGRRIIPGIERYTVLDRVTTDGHARIDLVAASAYGDPLLYWRICDANGEAEPADATQPAGRLLLIPMPLEVTRDGDA